MSTLDAMYQATHIVLQCRHTAWISYNYITQTLQTKRGILLVSSR